MPISQPVRALLELIGKVEAGKRGYNAIYLPAERKLGPQLLTKMSLAEVYALQTRMLKANAKSTAVGRYQFLRRTLTRIADAMKIGGNAKFDADLQDRLALHLMEERGLSKHLAGRLSRTAFANNLAKEWASLPVVTAINGKKIGQSYYAGDGINHALVKSEKILALIDALGAAQKPVAAPKPPIPAAVPIPTPPKPELAEVLMVGSRGPRVTALQTELVRLNYHTGGIDDIYGNLTRDAVQAFQADNGLEKDGMAGELTWAALATAKSRPLMAERKADTLTDLQGKGSTIADGAIKGKKFSLGMIWSGFLVGLAKIADSAGDLVGLPLNGLQVLFTQWGPWLLGTVLVGAGVFYAVYSNRIGAARLEDHHDARTL